MNPKKQTIFIGRFLLIYLIIVLPYKLNSQNRLTSTQDTSKAVISGWKRNAHIISLGFGVPSYANDWMNSMVKPSNSYTIASLAKSINLHLKFEVFVRKHLGLGITVNYGKINYDYLHAATLNYRPAIEKLPITTEVISLNARLNYHLLYNRVVDIYIGGGTGIRLVKTNGNHNFIPDIYKSGAFKEYEFSVGVRYFVKGIVGIYAEIGQGRTLFQAGINFNIRK